MPFAVLPVACNIVFISAAPTDISPMNELTVASALLHCCRNSELPCCRKKRADSTPRCDSSCYASAAAATTRPTWTLETAALQLILEHIAIATLLRQSDHHDVNIFCFDDAAFKAGNPCNLRSCSQYGFSKPSLLGCSCNELLKCQRVVP